MRLRDKAQVIRSKNAGPYELTYDFMFSDSEDMWDFYESLDSDITARVLQIPTEHVLSLLAYPPALAVKITVIRPQPSGALGETDVYGAQQHIPWLDYRYQRRTKCDHQ